MSEVIFSCRAYCKIILHSAKYPHCAINGVLLSKANSSTSSKSIEFVDAIPLFHAGLNLTPMAEIALTQIDQIASSQDLIISGYYTANENLKDVSLDRFNHRIPEKIAENFNPSCIVMVDNLKLNSTMDNVALKVAQYNDGKYKLIDNSRIVLNPIHTLDVCTSLLEQKSYKELIDFDNHLDDLSSDWKNILINREIAEIQ